MEGINIAELDRRIGFDQNTTTKDAVGALNNVWAEGEFFAWAKVEYKGGKKEEDNERVDSNLEVIFYIRNKGTSAKSLTAYDWRIGFPTSGSAYVLAETQYYYITKIEEFGGRDNMLRLTTELRTNEKTLP